METICEPRRLDHAWSAQYERLARVFAQIIGSTTGDIVEIGCGRGQLTIPLSKQIPLSKIVAVDRFQGPYRGDRQRLRTALQNEGLEDRVKLVHSDCWRWFENQSCSAHDVLISSELLAELDSAELRRFVAETYRVLRLGGLTVHSFLSPYGINPRQRRLITADSDPRWTKYPPKEWFSPSPELVRRKLLQAGFAKIRVHRVPSRIRFIGSAARILLRRWGVRQAFMKLNKEKLDEDGLEPPDWIVVEARKSRTHPIT